MRRRLIALAARRAALVERAGAEREALEALIARSEAATAWVGTARRLVEGARRAPLLVAAVAALLFALRPRRMIKLAASGWSLWRMYRGAERWWHRFAASSTTGSSRSPA